LVIVESGASTTEKEKKKGTQAVIVLEEIKWKICVKKTFCAYSVDLKGQVPVCTGGVFILTLGSSPSC
jgi:hypothetical protein